MDLPQEGSSPTNSDIVEFRDGYNKRPSSDHRFPVLQVMLMGQSAGAHLAAMLLLEHGLLEV
jgi:acetyl esterase/lipase